MSQLLILGGAVGPPFFVALFLIEGATRRGYDSLRQPVSALALGAGGWMQRTGFVVTGALTLGFVVALWAAPTGLIGMRWVAFLLGLYSAGLVGSGVFVTDPIGGYPPGAHTCRRSRRSRDCYTGSSRCSCSCRCFSPA